MGSRRIWPAAFRTIDGMIRGGTVVRVGCADCGQFFDVDLKALERRRGPGFSLVDQQCTCRLTCCRGRAYFVAAATMNAMLVTLVDADVDPLRLNGIRALDLEPPEPPPGLAHARARPQSLRQFVHQIEKRAAAG
jgi:hypothetical protein